MMCSLGSPANMNLPTLGGKAGWRSRLWRKHALVLSLVLTLTIVAFGVSEMIVSYGETRQQITRLQQLQAREVAQALEAALANVQRHVEAVTILPWSVDGLLTLDTRREEYGRLLRLVPAVESVAFHDGADREVLMVSRRVADRWAASAPVAGPTGSANATDIGRVYGSVEYQDGYDPYLSLELLYPEPAASGRTRVRIALRALARELVKPLSVPNAEAYVVDGSGTILLHRDPSIILERRKLSLVGRQAGESDRAGTEAHPFGLRGGEVLRSIEPLPQLRWSVVVEQSFAQAMEPVWATLQRTAAFMLVGLVLASLAAVYLAGTLTRPIRELHDGARSIGAGSLDTRIQVRTGDELEALAERFNAMASSVQDSHLHLEEKVAEKTRDLELANRHKSEFLANMSHELRTPLNAIIGFSEVLADQQMFGTLNPKQLEYARDIHGSGHHLLSLINDILDLSKIEAGRLDLDRAEFDVGAAIANAATLLRERAQRQAVTLGIDLSPQLTTWVADPRRFKQILVNLLTNAVKFTPAGGSVAVHARVERDELVVAVSDTGIGIADTDLPLIFEPFRQIGVDGKSQLEGTGLGLSLVRSLVEVQGGTLGVRSRLGEGSTFEFRLPRVSA
jgi:signal transduction histidine kinase